MSDRLRWPTVIAVSSVVMNVLVLGHLGGPIRLLVTFWFLFVCTGMAFVPLLAVPTLATELLLGVLTSLALDTLAATMIVEIGGLSATSGLIVLEAICLVGCALQAGTHARDRKARA